MTAVKLKIGLKPKQQLKARLIGRLKTVATLRLTEPHFAGLIKNIETDPLFEKLFFSRAGLPRVIRRIPWNRAKFHCQLFESQAAAAAGADPSSAGECLKNLENLMPKIRALGREAFERYFLYGETANSLADIEKATGLNLKEIERIQSALLDLSIASMAAPGPLGTPGPHLHFSVLASLERDSDTGVLVFIINAPHLARGRYNINREALKEWIEKDLLTPKEKKRLKELLSRIELVNLRQDTLQRILEALIEIQAPYLQNGKKSSMRALSMRALAKRLGLAASTISRAVSLRSVLLPWKQELPLAKLFSPAREVTFAILEETQNRASYRDLSDANLAISIKNDFGLALTRRTLNEHRQAWRKRP